jgi:hypothetical protein
MPDEQSSSHSSRMALLDKDGRLKQGSTDYKTVKKRVSGEIDRFGPEGAPDKIRGKMTRLLDQIWQNGTTCRPWIMVSLFLTE